jgi:Flp pilus assembly protein CpaB
MRRGRILILLGLILAVGTAAAVFILLQGATSQETVDVERETVVVAAQPIPEDEIVEGRVELRSVPVETIPQGALRDLESTTGMLAAGPIPQGTIIHPDLLISPQDLARQGELGKIIEPGFEAVAFPIDELSSVSYGIQASDHVDILMTFAFSDMDQEEQIIEPMCPPQCPTAGEEAGTLDTVQRPRLAAQLTLQDAQILGVGRWSFVPPPPEGQQQQGAEQAAAEPPRYITLMLTPQDALVDHQTFTTQQVTLDYILARFGVSLPVKQPYTIRELGAEKAGE